MRKMFTVAAVIGASVLAGGVVAVASTSHTEQPEGTQYACVGEGGKIAYMQFRRPDDPGYHAGTPECYDGPGGLTQWSWGQQGPAGADGQEGADGEDGVSGHEVRNTEKRVTGTGVLPISCPDGKVATGGGFAVSAGEASILASEPVLGGDNGDGIFSAAGWQVQYEVSTGMANIKPWVVCATMN